MFTAHNGPLRDMITQRCKGVCDMVICNDRDDIDGGSFTSYSETLACRDTNFLDTAVEMPFA